MVRQVWPWQGDHGEAVDGSTAWEAHLEGSEGVLCPLTPAAQPREPGLSCSPALSFLPGVTVEGLAPVPRAPSQRQGPASVPPGLRSDTWGLELTLAWLTPPSPSWVNLFTSPASVSPSCFELRNLTRLPAEVQK